ncbi:hypothetical protein [Agromyces badenianii]|nr:hypothetical protein [Agromyces badenianii]
MDDDLVATEPDCPNCGTRCVVIRGHYACRTCKIAVLEVAPEA